MAITPSAVDRIIRNVCKEIQEAEREPLTVTEAAAYLRVKESSVRHYLRNGAIKGYELPPVADSGKKSKTGRTRKSIRIDKKELREFVFARPYIYNSAKEAFVDAKVNEVLGSFGADKAKRRRVC